uniref:Uncharacterized protein n=1 Tax=Arundo donax TaxID=35708 RepID=A0A0A8Z8Z1_ARUDO
MHQRWPPTVKGMDLRYSPVGVPLERE